MEDFAKLLEEYLPSQEVEIQVGDKVEGTLIKIDRDVALVDIGRKKEAYIPIEQLKDRRGNFLYQPGDKIRAIVVKRDSGGEVYSLSVKKIVEDLLWEEIKRAYKERLPLKVRIFKEIKGGFEVYYKDFIKGFLPYSQISKQFIEIDKEIPSLILQLEGNSLVVSHKAYLEKERELKVKELERKIQEEGILEGTVKTLVKGGYLVDFGVLTGFLPGSEVSRSRVLAWDSLLAEGDVIKVKVLDWEPKQRKLKVSLKDLEPDPWERAEEKYSQGERVKGKVVKVFSFGIFVEIEPGMEAFLPSGEISWKRGLKPKDLLKEGDEIIGVITKFNPKERKMVLSLKFLEESPWERLSQQFTVGDKVIGVVKNVTNFGLFIEVLEGIDGFIPISKVAWERIENLKELYKVGDRVEAKIFELDPEKKRFLLSIKDLTEDPWEKLEEEIKLGDILDGEITEEKPGKGYLVRVFPQIKAFLPFKEIGEREKKGNQILKIGDKVKGKVILLDPKKRKLWLSEKAYLKEEEERELNSYKETIEASKKTLGEILKEVISKGEK